MLTIHTDQGRATEVDAGSAVEEADVAVAAHLASEKDHPVMRLVGALSEVGDQPQLTLVSGALLTYGAVTGDRRAALAGMRMLGSLAISFGLKTALKHLVARTRPNLLLDQGRYEVEPFGQGGGERHSFPSGHTAGSVAVACAFAGVYPEARMVAYSAAAAVALVQIPRGAHYPLDVAAGALVGVAAEALRDSVTQFAFGANGADASPAVQDERGRAVQEISAQGRRMEDRMIIRGESTLEQIDTIATNEKFRIRPLSTSLATYSEGPNAGFMRYLATEPTIVDALAYTDAASPEAFGRDPVTPRVTNPEAYSHILEALRLGYVEISDEAEPDHGLV